MSKTWKTRPLWVRLADKQDTKAHPMEHHDHTNGHVCDLPESPLAFGDRTTQCYWSYKYTGTGLCGCPMCTDHYWHKQENRSARRKNRLDLKRTGVVYDGN